MTEEIHRCHLAAARLIIAIAKRRAGAWDLFDRLKGYAASGQAAAAEIVAAVGRIARALQRMKGVEIR